MISKQCSKCKEIKEAKDFYKDKRGILGLYARCKKCHDPTTRKPEYLRKWREDNRTRLQAYRRDWSSKPKNKIDTQYGHALAKMLRGTMKTSQKEEDFGYSSEQLREHVESLFTPEMNWDNYGTYWHLDHVIPKHSFNYYSTDDKEFKECWALSNLQPLPKEKNWEKSKKMAKHEINK